MLITPKPLISRILPSRVARASAILANLGLSALLLTAGPLSAQESVTPGAGSDNGAVDAETGEPLEQFRVELIIFEYGDSLAGTGEDWSAPRDPEASEDDPGDERDAGTAGADSGSAEPGDAPGRRSATDDRSTETLAAAQAEEPDGTGTAGEQSEPVFRFMPLPQDALQLRELYRQLANASGYEPLLHVAWQQPGYEPETARPLDLSRLAQLPDRLRGEALLYRSRFLHLELNLELWSEARRGLSAPETARTERLFPDRGRSGAGERLRALEPDVYRLSERRKLRSGELHYYDHPRYGVLARVTPIEAEEEPEIMPGPGEDEMTGSTPADASSASR